MERVMAVWNEKYTNHPTPPIKVQHSDFPLFIDTSVSVNYDALPPTALNQTITTTTTTITTTQLSQRLTYHYDQTETIPKQFNFNIEERADLNDPNFDQPVNRFFFW